MTAIKGRIKAWQSFFSLFEEGKLSYNSKSDRLLGQKTWSC